MTVAVDLVVRGIREPVRFVIETPVKIFSQNSSFWYFNRRSLVQQFFLHSKEVLILMRLTKKNFSFKHIIHSYNIRFLQIIVNDNEIQYEVQSIDTSGEIDRNRLNLPLNLVSLIRSPSLTSIDTLTPKEDLDSGNFRVAGI